MYMYLTLPSDGKLAPAGQVMRRGRKTERVREVRRGEQSKGPNVSCGVCFNQGMEGDRRRRRRRSSSTSLLFRKLIAEG